MTLNPQNSVLVFFRFLVAVHTLSVNCDEMVGDNLTMYEQKLLRLSRACHELCSNYLFMIGIRSELSKSSEQVCPLPMLVERSLELVILFSSFQTSWAGK